MQNQNTKHKDSFSLKIKKIARKMGFDFCGIAPANKLTDEQQFFKKWLLMGCHGKMSYLEKNFNLRFDTSGMVENAKSVISLAVNYYPQQIQNPETRYKLSKYAYGEDYHPVLKDKLSVLLKYLKKEFNSMNGRGFVDSAPVMEKSWAQKAGLGWIGKNGCLIIPKHGSFYFLCEMIVDIELEYDKPFTKNYCGNCTKCINSCPTGAISKDGFVNAKKCISYLTIELKENIENNSKHPEINNWIFGCDICQDVCPWNRFAIPGRNKLFRLNNSILEFSDKQWEALTKEQYLSYIRKTNSPISRIKFDKLRSNINYAKTGQAGL